MGKFRGKDITGQRFGRLTVIEPSHKDARGEWHWRCLCDCGNECVATGNKLRTGHTKSCGCFQQESRGKARITHHMADSRLYVIWLNMRARCKNKNNTSYYRYGGRGISICAEWDKDFAGFMRWAIASGYRDGLSIERIDIDDGYKPENCKWIKKKQQYLNRSDSHLITAFGKTQTIKEWADETGIKYDTIERRINKYGWPPEKAVSELIRK